MIGVTKIEIEFFPNNKYRVFYFVNGSLDTFAKSDFPSDIEALTKFEEAIKNLSGEKFTNEYR